MKNKTIELLVLAATITFTVYAIWPAIGCEGDIVRGLFRLKCLQ